ncbi:hypothetical protein F442_21661 [Phytophthora nicotianae P10297]|uniref:Uncharacterized protein n=2 Tax=Phytophthora nicotianae TaxID=4792 RepID=W2QT53_PHYN3|nr:hypothetical protein PPTG_21902 [Phytophthora nicotianae INRA-310]ETN16342.1 hypothetical protein PPTG_21902 [Phytophthora nicotianae INRA-310]ETP29153.1 hypothetical protein F442_21661 [Phytophthora nicotianae P10297]
MIYAQDERGYEESPLALKKARNEARNVSFVGYME